MEVISALPVVKVCNGLELKLNVDELLHDGVGLFDLLLKYLHLVRQVVRARAVGGGGAVAAALRDVAGSIAPSERRVHAEVLLTDSFVSILSLSSGSVEKRVKDVTSLEVVVDAQRLHGLLVVL